MVATTGNMSHDTGGLDIMMTSCRPGQLGDTGIIVLQECGPLKKKGCDCEEKEEEEKTEKPKVSGWFSHIRTLSKSENIFLLTDLTLHAVFYISGLPLPHPDPVASVRWDPGSGTTEEEVHPECQRPQLPPPPPHKDHSGRHCSATEAGSTDQRDWLEEDSKFCKQGIKYVKRRFAIMLLVTS